MLGKTKKNQDLEDFRMDRIFRSDGVSFIFKFKAMVDRL